MGSSELLWVTRCFSKTNPTSLSGHEKSWLSWLIAASPFNVIRPPVAALTFDKAKLSASCAKYGMHIQHRWKWLFRAWTPRIDFSNNALADALPQCRFATYNLKRLYLLCSYGHGIYEGLDASETAWHANEYNTITCTPVRGCYL